MKITFNALFCGTIFLFYSCHSQPQPIPHKGYVVDPSVRAEVDKHVTNSMGSMYIRMFENDSLVLDSYKENKALECLLLPELDGDTAIIVGFMGFTAGMGFNIYLFKDTCIVHHFAKSDAKIYKLHPEDSLFFQVFVPCKNYKLTLVAPPEIKKGGSVEGRVELASEEYYEVSNGVIKRYRVNLTAYFSVKLSAP